MLLMKNNQMQLSPQQYDELISILKGRFDKNMNRHKHLEWTDV